MFGSRIAAVVLSLICCLPAGAEGIRTLLPEVSPGGSFESTFVSPSVFARNATAVGSASPMGPPLSPASDLVSHVPAADQLRSSPLGALSPAAFEYLANPLGHSSPSPATSGHLFQPLPVTQSTFRAMRNPSEFRSQPALYSPIDSKLRFGSW